MIIDIPVRIEFDHDGSSSTPSDRRLSRVFTLRYDTDAGNDFVALIAKSYPPRNDGVWFPDHDGVLFGLLAPEIDRVIAAKALADPASYAPHHAPAPAAELATAEG